MTTNTLSRRGLIAGTVSTWVAGELGCSSGTDAAAGAGGSTAGRNGSAGSGVAGALSSAGASGSASGASGSAGNGGSDLGGASSASAGGGASVTAGAAGASGAAGAASAGSPILDVHTHFFDPNRPIPAGRTMSVPWPPADSVLYRTTLPPEYAALAAPLGITRTVTIEASAWLEDNQWVLDLAAKNDIITGFVANLSEVLGTANFASALASLQQNPLVRGIRVSPAQLSNSNMANFAALAQQGLMIDVLGNPPDLTAIAAFAQSLPTLRIVIDHVANVSINGQAPPAIWVSGMNAAARQPNVYCKISGLVEGSGMTGNAPINVDFYRPTLDVVWQAFGEDRLVFGSNWPVSSPFAPLSTVLAIPQAYFAEKGVTASNKCFAENGKAAYGL